MSCLCKMPAYATWLPSSAKKYLKVELILSVTDTYVKLIVKHMNKQFK